MLEQIKIVLGITDTSKDNLINYYINSISSEVMNYCNLKSIPTNLEYFIQSKVISIFRYESNEYKGIKSLVEGDVKLEFAIQHNGADTMAYSLNDEDKKVLRNFRRRTF